MRCTLALSALAPGLSAAQTQLWSQTSTTPQLKPIGATSDSSGNIYIAYPIAYSPGPTYLDLAYGPLASSPLGGRSSYLPSRGIRVIKYSQATGSVSWSTTVYNTHEYFIFTCVGIDLDSNGNVILGGTYWATETPDLGPTFEESVFFVAKVNGSTGAYSPTTDFAQTADNTDADSAAAMLVSGSNAYITGSEGSAMYTAKFSTSPSLSWTRKTSGSGAGTCLALNGSNLIVGGNVPSGSGKDLALWDLGTSSGTIGNTTTHGVNHLSGDTLASVAVSSGGAVYATGTTQRIVSSVILNDTRTIGYSSDTYGTQTLNHVTNGNGAYPAPSGLNGTDGGKQVLIDPTDSEPIVLATVGHKITTYKINLSTSGLRWSFSMQEVTGSKPTTYWDSEAAGMKLSSNGALFVFGTSWDSVYTSNCHYAVAKMTTSGSGGYTWGPSWQYLTGQNQVVASGLTVYTLSGTDYVGVTGGVYNNQALTRVFYWALSPPSIRFGLRFPVGSEPVILSIDVPQVARFDRSRSSCRPRVRTGADSRRHL